MRIAFVVLLVIGIAGCGSDSPTAPPPAPEPFRLSLSYQASITGTWESTDRYWMLVCRLPLTVTTFGDGFATWSHGRMTWIDPTFGMTSLDRGQDDLVSTFGSSRVHGGDQFVSTWIALGTGQHQHAATLYYTLETGELRSATISFSCVAP